jgi:methylmalonyl-CoA/ethylmalonyl-CoA epimerase
MKLGRLHHVGIVTPSVDASVAFYRDVMGAQIIHAPFDKAGAGIRFCFVETDNTMVELLQPLDGASPLAEFLQSHPKGGQHHLCYEVGDIQAAWNWFAGKGATMLGSISMGVLGHPIFFMAADGMDGILTEIIEIKAGDAV